VKVHCELVIPSEGRDLDPVFRSLQVDNAGYVEGSLEDDRMVFTFEGPVGETRNSLNDLLACLQNAMGVADELSGDE
jgi:hypothetical protein